ncbi:type II toxin-antitoxin system RelB/DinJ family antitoxin [Collinsella tanakaei]|uniref:type II toxin-antitoxin system RelB/DinJ family antitoxin n=1 Tax=Collinsella tanakaei TaxID=626935 RepID=UPI001F16DD8E|nr:type II toxin-antitoxin system RelB/DinJ family antitoxin [Collinsella tanakaei]MCF2621252.1 type II toxin-antitoxin system RelB/DinJ family antitoxin [Collinsella tanakaei]
MAERMTPVVAKVLPEEKAAFAAATRQVGTTPSNAIRMFIAAFNRCGTFPFDISARGVFGEPVSGDTSSEVMS